MALPLLVLGAGLNGCAAALFGAGTATTVAVAHDRRTTGTMVDDELIEWKVQSALASDKELWEKSHINITSYDNIVLLSGETPTEKLRERATELARQVDKVRAVHNELQVAAPSALLSRSSDTWITSKVKSAMLTDGNVPGTRIKVVTEAGTVYLMGLVTHQEGAAATEVARSVSGVQRVVKLFEYVKVG